MKEISHVRGKKTKKNSVDVKKFNSFAALDINANYTTILGSIPAFFEVWTKCKISDSAS
jgi:hypothetical protein